MSSEEKLPRVYNKRLLDDQIGNIPKRVHVDDFLNGIIKELCDLYNDEVRKGNSAVSILDSIDHYM
ncbi:6291_t:CDS:1, partial [Cetraspora pellucida]